MGNIAQLSRDLEDAPLPVGEEERFAGWGVMGLPFASGHALALRRYPASSIGPAYSSVWHRSPSGTWRMWQDVDPDRSCPRYFSSVFASAHRADIKLTWVDTSTLTVQIPDTLTWSLTASSTAGTRFMNSATSWLPQSAWRSAPILRLNGKGRRSATAPRPGAAGRRHPERPTIPYGAGAHLDHPRVDRDA